MVLSSHPTVSGQGNRPSRSEHPELVEGRSRRLRRQAQDAATRLFCKSVRWLVVLCHCEEPFDRLRIDSTAKQSPHYRA
jgi:hypothetical protein